MRDRGGSGVPRCESFPGILVCHSANTVPRHGDQICVGFRPRLREYGSVVFVSGNMPYRTEIAPVLIVARLEEFAYGEAATIAAVLLGISFSMLIIINLLERWSNRYGS